MVKFCPTCKKVYPITTTVCPGCHGSNLMRFCQNCKKMLPPGAISCPVCGDTDTTQITTATEKPGASKERKKKKGKILFLSLALIVVAGVVFVYKSDILHDFLMTDDKRDQEISEALHEEGVYAAASLVREYYHESNPKKAAQWYILLLNDLEDEIIDDVKIVDGELDWGENYYDYYVTVKNDTLHTLSYVKINIYMKDKDKNIVDSTWTNWSGTLLPGASAVLDKMIPNNGKWETVEASVSDISIEVDY